LETDFQKINHVVNSTPYWNAQIAQSVGNLNKNTITDAESCKFESVLLGKVTQSTPGGKYAQPDHLSPQRETQDEEIYSQARLEARFEYSHGKYFCCDAIPTKLLQHFDMRN